MQIKGLLSGGQTGCDWVFPPVMVLKYILEGIVTERCGAYNVMGHWWPCQPVKALGGGHKALKSSCFKINLEKIISGNVLNWIIKACSSLIYENHCLRKPLCLFFLVRVCYLRSQVIMVIGNLKDTVDYSHTGVIILSCLFSCHLCSR